MVFPITIVDDTSNDSDEIEIILSIDLSIDEIDYDPEGSKSDASAINEKSATSTIEKAANITIENAKVAISTIEKAATINTEKVATSTTEKETTSTIGKAGNSITENAKVATSTMEEATTSTIEKAATIKTKKATTITTEKAATITNEKAATITSKNVATSTTKKAATSTAKENATKTTNTKLVQDQKETISTMRIYSKASPYLSLCIRNGNIILANSNPLDPCQHWFKDEKYSTKVKDEQGYLSFALVNKGTNQAIKHSMGPGQNVQLITYNPNKIDESVLWTSKEMGDYTTIRAVNNIHLLFDALNDNGYRDGTKIILWGSFTGNNQCWKIDTHTKPTVRMYFPNANEPTLRIYTKAWTNYSLSIRNGNVIIANYDPSDPSQHWIKIDKYGAKVRDEQGHPSFALVNKATGEAIKHSFGHDYPVQLIYYDPNKIDRSVLWTESDDLGDSYKTIRMVNEIRLLFDALNHAGVRDGTKIILWEHFTGDNQRWKMVPY